MADRTKVITAIILLGVAVAVIAAFVGATAFFFKSPSPSPAVQSGYTQQQLDYFGEIAFTPPEYGDMNETIGKWDGDIRINITGAPEYTDIEAILSATGELKGKMGNVSLSLSDNDANLLVYVGPEEPVLSYLEIDDTRYSHGGFFFWNRNGSEYIERAVIAISSDHYDSEARAYNLRYALAYILGLKGTSPQYPDSIFYENYSRVDHYSDLDLAIIRMLYDDRVKAGMTKDEALAVLKAGR